MAHTLRDIYLSSVIPISLTSITKFIPTGSSYLVTILHNDKNYPTPIYLLSDKLLLDLFIINMSSDNISRKKSYRWASATQTSYDGADWDSSDDDDTGTTKREIDTGKPRLPSLPKLNYSNEDMEKENNELPTPGIKTNREESSSYLETPTLNRGEDLIPKRNSPVRAVNDDLDNLMLQISKEMTPKIGNESVFVDQPISDDNSKSNTPYFNASASIGDSKSDLNMARHEALETNVKQEEDEEKGDEDDDDDISIPEKGFFSKYIESEEAHETNDGINNNEVTSIISNEGLPIENSVTTDVAEQDGEVAPEQDKESSDMIYKNEKNETTDIRPRKPSNGDINEFQEGGSAHHQIESDISEGKGEARITEQNSKIEDRKGRLPIEKKTYAYGTGQHQENESVHDEGEDKDDETYDDSDDSYLDRLSYTKSIKYTTRNPSTNFSSRSVSADDEEDEEDEDFKFSNKNRQSIIDSSDDEEGTDSDSSFKVSKSGYFGKMVEQDSEKSDTTDHEVDNNKDSTDDVISLPQTIISSEEEEEQESKKVIDGKEAIVGDIRQSPLVEDSVSEKQDDSSSILSSEHEKTIEAIDGKDAESTEKGTTETHSSDDDGSIRESVNFESWKPDTDALRSGFVQDTNKRAPPGFVYDDSGKLIDLTPSSMKSSAVSTYSEMESSWNAFPSGQNGGDDLETIRDTKTLYDNNTIYNVPGLVTNNDNLPPLPNNILTEITAGNIMTRSPTATSDIEKRSVKSNHSEATIVPKPDSEQLARLNGPHKIPTLNLNEVISSKNSHSQKIEILQNYSKELAEYDTGIQTWINYSLKSNSQSNNDLLLDEYKNNNHVREAYANAEELSKKNTVINTVVSVNQNVTHLRKKVFSHSMKSRGLLSSIGKKIIEK
ncbi:Fyv8p NDAI_0D02200 [Naumovozyma dairenensis CBS 421]|uniref:Protein FYV8 n=1 Tax=Naumovozyma dairenensis (strain ATCC 10597 / BCRC 20456 / CBS 421 / NBRC 0211 / NRRL Y-12639) TaxID=1071378 RepID=G0W9S3_NAUDC|nr:hypothetical protein NDAI_0D02200 [Naumovozyma dairenensis CBS 421]CCD24534.1 hypothetical protein NDAI_0D02200 [Naumovozyma dairenensis CBS 421]